MELLNQLLMEIKGLLSEKDDKIQRLNDTIHHQQRRLEEARQEIFRCRQTLDWSYHSETIPLSPDNETTRQ